jgi:hypothetical protein
MTNRPNTHPVVEISSLEDIAVHFESLASEANKKMSKARPVEAKVLTREMIVLRSCAAFVRWCKMADAPAAQHVPVVLTFTDPASALLFLQDQGFTGTKNGWKKDRLRAIVESTRPGFTVTLYAETE